MSVVKKTATGKKFLEKVNTGADTGIVSGDKFVDGTIPTDAVFTGGNVGIDVQPTEKLSVQGIIESKTGGIKFPDATVQTTASSGGKFVDGSNPVDAVFTGGNVGIDVQPTEKLSVQGIIESKTGGVKFPDATIQTTAANNPQTVDSKIITYRDVSDNQKSKSVIIEGWDNPNLAHSEIFGNPPLPEKLRWSQDGKFLIIEQNSSGVAEIIILQETSKNVFTKLSQSTMNTDIVNSTTNGSDWSPNGQYLAIGDQFPVLAIDRLKIFKRFGNTFDRIPSPTTTPTGAIVGLSWSKTNYLAIAVNTSPFLMVYRVDGETFTKLNDPATLPLALDHPVVEWSPDGQYLAFCQAGSGTDVTLEIFKLTGNTLTKLPSPAFNPLGVTFQAAWSSDSQFLALGISSSPYLVIYQRIGDTFTQVTNINYSPSDIVRGVAFHPNDKDFVILEQLKVTGSLVSFNISGTTFTRISDLPNNINLSQLGLSYINFSPDGRYLAASMNTTVEIYNSGFILPNKPRINVKEIIDDGVIESQESLFRGRMTTAERDALTPKDGMIIYNTTTSRFNFRESGAWVTGSGLL